MQDIPHIQNLSPDHNRFVGNIQAVAQIEKGIKITKSKAVSKLIDYAIKHKIDLKEIIR